MTREEPHLINSDTIKSERYHYLASSNSMMEIPNNESDTKELPSNNLSLSRSLTHSLIYLNKQEFLFIFGGYGPSNEPVIPYEVLDV